MIYSPFQTERRSVAGMMCDVLIALLPAVIVMTVFFGVNILIHLVIISLLCILCDVLLIVLGQYPRSMAMLLSLHGTSLITGWLIVLSFPSTVPVWLLCLALLIALIIGKYLYGHFGQNPFNPAMLAYAACLIAFPALMSHWQTPHMLSSTGWLIHGQPIDAIASATPLDHTKTQLHQHLAIHPLLPLCAILLSAAYLIGGLYLLIRRTIRWPLPVYFLCGLLLPAALLWLYDPTHYTSPLFHLLNGGSMICAFFIITDPISGPSTPRSQCILGLLTGALTYIIRVFGGYPDGIAFAILMMNLLAPLVDRMTIPPIFGHTRSP